MSINLQIKDTELDVSRTIYMLYMDLDLQIARADTKSQVILSTTTLVSALLIGFGLSDEIAQDINELKVILLILIGFMFLMLIWALIFALRASFPSIKKSHDMRNKGYNLYFFGDIADLDPSDYVIQFGDMTNAELRDAALAQIHAKSMIAQTKFRFVQLSMQFLFAAVVLMAIIQFLQLFI